MKVTLSNVLSNVLLKEAEVIKDTNSALEDMQETSTLSLVDSLKVGDHIAKPTIINILKDLEDLQLKYGDRLEENENIQDGLKKAQ